MIAPIQGLTGYSPVSRVIPMNYSVKNDAELSAVYNSESTKNSQGVTSVRPVLYPNAQEVEDVKAQRSNDVKAADKIYNDIASSFNGNVTGYTNMSVGTNYGIIGGSFDMYA